MARLWLLVVLGLGQVPGLLAAEKDASLTADQKERKIKLIRKTARAQVFAVLTPDQQKTWSWEQHEKHEPKSQPPKSQ